VVVIVVVRRGDVGVGAGGGGTPGVRGCVVDIKDTPEVGADCGEESIEVTSGVLVTRVLNRVGGATLPNHPVVPFTTEKKYVPRAGFDGEELMRETVMTGPGIVT
jgi:hypothetical protein